MTYGSRNYHAVCKEHVPDADNRETITLGLIIGRCEICGRTIGSTTNDYIWVSSQELEALKK